jgi:ABC-type Fe3+/spermidine/putrescine transport system ATPase subunit
MSLSGRSVALAGVSKHYGAVRAVDGIDLAVAPGEFCTLLGPSGSGKTTLLKLIAGFEAPSAGTLSIDGRDMAGVPVAKRDIGMVFQNYALFPNMTVAENVAFPLEARHVSRAAAAPRVRAALELVAMAAYEPRYPRELSGGQQQRVALARALVFDPVILLMDEPLGALDKNLRQAIQLELKLLHRRLGVTIVYVTHDQEEALFLSDRLVVLDAGRIAQVGRPEDLYRRPASRFVAGFLGDCNLLSGRVEGDDVVLDAGARLHVSAPPELGEGARVTIGIRPERVRLMNEAGRDRMTLRVRETIFLGAYRKLVLERDGLTLLALIPDDPAADALAPGAELHVGFDAASAVMLPG